MDTHVIAETSSCVQSLAGRIEDVLKSVDTTVARAQEHLGPVGDSLRDSTTLRANINNVIDCSIELRDLVSELGAIHRVLKQGIPASGLEKFAQANELLENFETRVCESPYGAWPGIVDRIKAAHIDKARALDDQLKLVLNKTLPPPDPEEYFNAGRDMPPLDKGRLGALASLVSMYELQGRVEVCDRLLAAAFTEYARLSMKVLPKHLSSPERLRAYVSYANSISEMLQLAVTVIFEVRRPTDPSRPDRLLRGIQQAVKNEQARASQGLSAANSGGSNDYLSVFQAIESEALLSVASGADTSPELRDKGINALRKIYEKIDSAVKNEKSVSETSVCGATAVSLSLLRSLSKWNEGIDICLEKASARAYLPRPLPEWATRGGVSGANAMKNATAAQQFHADLLECLLYNLSAVAKQSGFKPPQQGLFMLVNQTAIEHYLKTNNLMPLFGPPGAEALSRSLKQAFKLFLTDWERLSSHLLDQTLTAAKAPGAKLSSKDRENVKERFRLFNAEFEMLIERQKRYSLTDGELRLRIANEISHLIRPLYKRFHDKHAGGDFTKYKEKYIKYDMRELDAKLSSIA